MKMFLIGLLAGMTLAFLLMFVAVIFIGKKLDDDKENYFDE